MYHICRDNSNHVTNPAYCSTFGATNIDDKALSGYEEHIYDTINCYDDTYEQAYKAEQSNMEPSAANLENPYDDNISIKSDDVSFDQLGGYSVPDFKGNEVHSSMPKPLAEPRYANTLAPGATAVADDNVQLTSKNLSTDDKYVLHDAKQQVSNDDYILHEATQRHNTDEYVSLDTMHVAEIEEYITQDVTHTAESNGYTLINPTHHTIDSDYQDVVLQSPPPPGYSVPSNIPATS